MVLDPEVAVGIPTFRRPERLTRLLESLAPSLRTHRVYLIVADNGCDEATKAAVEVFAAKNPETLYVAVPERGISAARNALIDTFLAQTAGTRWLAMLDDDLAVGPDWLSRMVGVAERLGADVTAGPYAIANKTGLRIVDESLFLKRERRPTGTTPPVNAAGNILLSRKLLERTPKLRFDQVYGLSGGEDYDFFQRASRIGANFAWCDEAFADEHVDSNRLGARAVIYRYYSTGNYMGVIDVSNLGGKIVAKRAVVTLAGAIAVLGQGALRLDYGRVLLGLFRGLLAVGAIAAVLGFRTYRYRLAASVT